MKRIFAGMFGMAMVVGMSQLAEAKTLEDILKEKGVITEEDYKQVVKSRPVKYKPGEGFNFNTDDGNFSGSLGSMFQVRYSYTDLDKAGQDSSSFESKRVKLYMGGKAFLPDLTYKLQINLANLKENKTSNGGILEETYLNYRLRDDLQFLFGQNKVQFGRQALCSATVLQFVDQSIVTQAFFPTYDTAFMVHGKVADGLVNYNVNVAGGVGQNNMRSTSDNAFNARLTVNPFGEMRYSESDVEYSEKALLSFGGNFYRNTLSSTEAVYNVDTGNHLAFMKPGTGWFGLGNTLSPAAGRPGNEPLDINMFSVDTVFKWRGLSVQAEYMYGDAEGQTTNRSLAAQGLYAQAGYFVIPKKVEVAYRYSYLDPNHAAANDHWIENTAALSWYIAQHRLKLQTDYARIHKQRAIGSTAGVETDDDQLRLQAQILF